MWTPGVAACLTTLVARGRWRGLLAPRLVEVVGVTTVPDLRVRHRLHGCDTGARHWRLETLEPARAGRAAESYTRARVNRRELFGLGARAAGVALASSVSPRWLRAAEDPPIPAARRRLLQLNGYAPDVETPLDALTSYLTPNDLFFVRHHWLPQPVERASWRLTVDGDVGAPLSLTLGDLERLPRVETTCVLQCAGNGRALFSPVVPGVQWRYGAVGNARWTGVRAKDVLAKAKLKGAAKHLHTFGSDKPPGKVPPFHRSLELEKVLEDGIIAFEMNGEPLPDLHGAPARLVVPGWAGDHWMKWLERISAKPEPMKGFYVDVGYRFPKKPGEPGLAFKPEEMAPVTGLFVKSSFTGVPGSVKAGAPFTVRGFAFSGAPGIEKVEVSSDDGGSWQTATLDPRHDRYSWRLFSHRLIAKAPGKLELVCRATDSRGSVQPRAAVWNQSGYLHNGWHAVEVEALA